MRIPSIRDFARCSPYSPSLSASPVVVPPEKNRKSARRTMTVLPLWRDVWRMFASNVSKHKTANAEVCVEGNTCEALGASNPNEGPNAHGNWIGSPGNEDYFVDRCIRGFGLQPRGTVQFRHRWLCSWRIIPKVVLQTSIAREARRVKL